MTSGAKQHSVIILEFDLHVLHWVFFMTTPHLCFAELYWLDTIYEVRGTFHPKQQPLSGTNTDVEVEVPCSVVVSITTIIEGSGVSAFCSTPRHMPVPN